jgi:hypothetical protein
MKKLFSLLVLSVFFIGCTTIKEVVKEVPVEVIREVEKTVYVHDTTYTKDSVIIYQRGDTIFKEKLIYKYVGKTVHDTLRTHDTIPQIINTETTVTKTVNKPQWWPVWLAVGIVLLYLLLTKTNFGEIIKNFIKYVIKLFK